MCAAICGMFDAGSQNCTYSQFVTYSVRRFDCLAVNYCSITIRMMVTCATKKLLIQYSIHTAYLSVEISRMCPGHIIQAYSSTRDVYHVFDPNPGSSVPVDYIESQVAAIRARYEGRTTMECLGRNLATVYKLLTCNIVNRSEAIGSRRRAAQENESCVGETNRRTRFTSGHSTNKIECHLYYDILYFSCLFRIAGFCVCVNQTMDGRLP